MTALSFRPESPAPARRGKARPEKIGRDWHVLFTAGAVSVLGDGAFVAALPLLAAGYTRDPRLISGLTVTGTLPWLVFSLQAGAIADRSESRQLSIRAQGWQMLCVLGVGLLAMDRGAGWGLAALFAVTPTLPFWADAVTFAVSMLLISRLPRPAARATAPDAERRSLAADMKEGLLWLARHPLLRTTTMLSATANLGMAPGTSTLVLYVGTHHYGVLLSVAAIGGVAGGLVSRAVVARIGGRTVARLCSSVTPLAGIGIGVFGPDLFVVAALLGVGSMSASLWNVAIVTQRQRLVPAHLLGRVSRAGIMVVWEMQPLGALLGGLIATGFGLAAPWVVGGSPRVVAAALAIRPLRQWQD